MSQLLSQEVHVLAAPKLHVKELDFSDNPGLNCNPTGTSIQCVAWRHHCKSETGRRMQHIYSSLTDTYRAGSLQLHLHPRQDRRMPWHDCQLRDCLIHIGGCAPYRLLLRI